MFLITRLDGCVFVPITQKFDINTSLRQFPKLTIIQDEFSMWNSQNVGKQT